jgi:hypothetical protein
MSRGGARRIGRIVDLVTGVAGQAAGAQRRDRAGAPSSAERHRRLARVRRQQLAQLQQPDCPERHGVAADRGGDLQPDRAAAAFCIGVLNWTSFGCRLQGHVSVLARAGTLSRPES